MRYFLIFLLFVSLPVFADNGVKNNRSALSDENVTVDSDLFNEGAFDREVIRFENKVKEFHNEIERSIAQKIADKRNAIEEKYSAIISEKELSEANNRRDTIVLLERFLKRYSENPKYTPSVMYRLAELYYERSMINFAEQTKKFDEDLEKFDKGEIKDEPVLPEVDFSDSTKLYTDIIRKFPDFRHIGSVYYLLGYCYAESGMEDKAVEVWL